MDKLRLFNEVARAAKPMHRDYTFITDLNVTFVEADLDSLDVLLICVYFSEMYGIEEEVAKTMLPTRPQEIFDFLEAHKTREPQSIDEALEYIK